MTAFEKRKNIKATYITVVIVGALIILALLISWTLPTPPPVPVFEEGMEVNFGDNLNGFGQIEPLRQGKPAASTEPVNVPPQQAAQSQEDKDVLRDENDKEAPVIPKKEEKKPVVKPTPVKTETKPTVTKPTVNPTPVPPKPKAQMGQIKGGTNNGGNSDDYNNSNNQGTGNGKGNSGVPTGNPNTNGNGGKGNGTGPRIVNGDRVIVNHYIFQGDLPAAIVNARIKVSPDGKGTFMGIAQGSSTTQKAYSDAIINYLKNMKFNTASNESIVVVEFKFTVN